MDGINNSSDEFKSFLKEIYNQIKEEHQKDTYCDEIPTDLAINALLNVELRPYQYKSLRWLINREFNPGIPGSSTGGILADEMGLGKTIEILSLILLNKRENLQIPETKENMEDEYSSSDDEPLTKIRKKNDNPNKTKQLYCVCRKTNKTKVIECTKCHKVQHKNCVVKYDDKINNKKYEKLYICPECWTNNHINSDTQQLELIKSKATIIISPQIIANQWHDEIKKCSKNSLEILIYDGIVKTGWINPDLLSKYDIIITNYTVLQKEIHHHMQRSHNLRSQKTYIRVDSPLLFIEWWRVCLDEAQMVENVTNNAAKMVKQLPAVHRWAVTGTPIHKCIDDLRGLLEFLEVKPYYEQQEWKKLTNSYMNNEQPKLLIELLAKFMWRTCKNDVANELNIPEQSFVEHFPIISDIEKLFYTDELHALLNSFEEKVRKYVRIHTMQNLDKKTIKLLLEPLRKLRQNCSTPVLHFKAQQNMIKRRLLSPSELSEHLIDKNQILCKTSLRMIVSCFNGIAALHMIIGEYEKAITCYETVLDIAEEYTAPICVDSLLQIHALHNLMLAKTELNLQIDLNEYNNQCKKLEWKYLETYYNDLLKALTNVKTSNNEVNECIKKFKNKNISNWWHKILAQTVKTNTSQQLLNKINDERRLLTFDSPSTTLLADFSTTHGVDYALGGWTNKIIKQRQNICEMFGLFDNFINNIKPLNQLPVQIQNEMRKTIRSVIDCHLNNAKKTGRDNESSWGEDDDEDEYDDIFKEKCNLCKIKEQILEYECTIYRKNMKKQKQTAEGDSNPSIHETALRHVLSFARIKFTRNDLEAVHSEIEIGDLHLKYLDALKKEQKIYTKLWIEIEYIIKAYDELDMCKMRLQYENSPQNNEVCGINSNKVQLTYLQNKLQLITANTEFKKQQGRLNYINHLKNGADMGPCPVCKLDSYQEYSVMECGHFLCIKCLKGMAEARRSLGIICAICRIPQTINDMFLVTKRYRTNEDKRIACSGRFSSKIEEILITVVKLLRQDSNIKIVIFSHWSIILRILSKALNTNDVKYLISATPKNIREFKDTSKGITCFLLQLKQASNGLNLTEATHVFLIEPILDPGEEAQAIGRIHRIGQTRPTVVHRFFVKGTIEETIRNATSEDIKKIWSKDHLDIDYIRKLFLSSVD